MSVVSKTFRCWSRSWGRIGATVATFALAAALLLSCAPAAGAAESFGSPVQLSAGLSASALALGDFGGATGEEDVAAIAGNSISLIRGQGGGAFAPPVSTNLGSVGFASDIATLPNPLSGAGAYAAISEPANESIDIGLFVPKFLIANQPFHSVQQLSLAAVGCNPTHIAVGNFGNSGGADDFAVQCANTVTASDGNSNSNEIVVVLAAPPATPGANPTWAVSQTLFVPIQNLSNITTVVDNAAGGVDIVATAQPGIPFRNEGALDVFRPSGVPGIFELSPQFTRVEQDFFDAGFFIDPGIVDIPYSIATATTNGGSTVIAGSLTTNGFPPLVSYPGLSDGTFPMSTVPPDPNGIEEPTAMATGLFDENSVADLAVAGVVQQGTSAMAIDTGTGTGAFTAGVPLVATGDFEVSDMQVGELNGEGLDDIAYTASDGLFVLYQDAPEFVRPIGIGPGPVDVFDETQPVASDVGLLIQRRGKPRRVEAVIPTPTGTKRVALEVPTFINVGRIPLGHHQEGRNTIRYKLLVNGHPLAPGSYIVTLRSLNAKGQVLDLSQPVALTVDLNGDAHFGKHVLV